MNRHIPTPKPATSQKQIERRVDFASRTLGSRVYLHGTTPSFKTSWWSDWLPLIGSHSHSPAVVFKNDHHSDLALGDCWCFAGSRGQITVLLAHPVVPTEFSIEHIGDSMNVVRSSAPKRVQVYAVPDEEPDDTGVLLAEYEYSLDGAATQSFKAQHSDSTVRSMIRLAILSNHGHPQYTCLYRFHVHSSITVIE
jgi:SUN domain-containing protein 1/2